MSCSKAIRQHLIECFLNLLSILFEDCTRRDHGNWQSVDKHFLGSLRVKIRDPKDNNFLRVLVFDISADWPKNTKFYTREHYLLLNVRRC